MRYIGSVRMICYLRNFYRVLYGILPTKAQEVTSTYPAQKNDSHLPNQFKTSELDGNNKSKDIFKKDLQIQLSLIMF